MQLGALTRGDRRAAIGGDWTDVNQLESRYGRQALAEVIEAGRQHMVVQTSFNLYGVGGVMPEVNPAAKEMADALDGLGLDKDGKDDRDVKKFLNRLLGLPVRQQNGGKRQVRRGRRRVSEGEGMWQRSNTDTIHTQSSNSS